MIKKLVTIGILLFGFFNTVFADGDFLMQLGSTSGNNLSSGVSAQFNLVNRVSVDSSGNIYLFDTINHILKKYDSAGTYITQIAFSWDNFDTDASYLYVSKESSGCRIDRYSHANLAGGFTTVIGSTAVGGDNNLGGTSARIGNWCSVGVSGNYIIVTDVMNYKIKVYNKTTFAWVKTLGSGVSTYNTSAGASAGIKPYFRATLDSLGNLYLTESMQNRVRVYDTNLNWLYDIGSALGTGGDNDSEGSLALLSTPNDLETNSAGNLQVVSFNRLKKYQNGILLSNIGSSNTSNGDNLLSGTGAKFNGLQTVSIDSSSNVYVADRWNYKIKKYSDTSIYSCASTPSYVNASYSTGTATSINQTWVKNAVNCGFTCTNGYSGNSCEIAPYCAVKPSYPNATFNTGSVVTANQAWVKDASICGYTCNNGYSGNDCNTRGRLEGNVIYNDTIDKVVAVSQAPVVVDSTVTDNGMLTGYKVVGKKEKIESDSISGYLFHLYKKAGDNKWFNVFQ